MSKEFNVSASTPRQRGRLRDWQRATRAHECVKIEVPDHKLDLGIAVPWIQFRGPSLNVDHRVWPTRRRVDGCGAAQITFGVPGMTLTCHLYRISVGPSRHGAWSPTTCDHTALRSGIWESNAGTSAGDGRTIELRIRTSRRGGGSARCSGSRARVQPRNFFPHTPSSTTHSTSKAISPQPKPTACFALRR